MTMRVIVPGTPGSANAHTYKKYSNTASKGIFCQSQDSQERLNGILARS